MTLPSVQILEGGVGLTLEGAGRLPLGSRVMTLADSTEERDALLVLDELWGDGLLEEIEDASRWVVPFERLPEVLPDQARALRLPAVEERLESELRAHGIVTSPNFSIELVLRHQRFGELDADRRNGPAFLLPGDHCVVLPQPLFALLVLTTRAPDEQAPTEDRFEYLGACVEAGQKAGAQLDAYLTNNPVEVVDELQLDVSEERDELELSVRAGTLGHDSLVAPNGRALPYPREPQAAGSRRIVPKASREKIEKIHKRRRLRGSQVPEFLENPEAFVPEGIDLADFSERVRGFKTRVYNSRPYIHVRKEPAGWLDYESGAQLTPVHDGHEESGLQLSSEEYKALAAQAQASGERFVKHGDDWVEIDPNQAKGFNETEERLDTIRQSENVVTRRYLLDVIPNVDMLEFEVDLPEELHTERPWVDELPDIAPPSIFRGTLDPSQDLGFRWLVFLNQRKSGGLLADEMGVGKTAQVIALLAHLHATRTLSPTLIVVPNALIPNWLRELETFAPTIDRVHVHTGSQRARTTEALTDYNIIITTYDTARSDQVLLGMIDWRVVVADEAQFIKNPTAARTSVLKAMKADQALALTGTPVENGLIEFWCILDYVQPGLLDSWSDFRTVFERPLAEATDEAGREKLVETLLGRLDPHYLRRLKSEVLKDLPSKNVLPPQTVGMSPIQSERYQGIIDDAREGGRGKTLGAIINLLITCAHPRAVFRDWVDIAPDQLIAECPKLSATLDMIRDIRERDEKVVIFTEWKGAQSILRRSILHRFATPVEIINGDTTSRRQSLIDSFRREPGFGALILNPQVAGFGINLVEANHVIHYTRPWNPAKENQATDRVHRRGQTKPVHVYYPTVQNTVEEKLAALLAEKARLAQDVLRPTAERVVTQEDLLGPAGLA